jgi:hypothetical protein
MKLGYDIFRQLDDGSPIWIANMQTRTQAQQKVATLRPTVPARYFVRDADTGAVITDSEPGARGKNLCGRVTTEHTPSGGRSLFLKLGNVGSTYV